MPSVKTAHGNNGTGAVTCPAFPAITDAKKTVPVAAAKVIARQPHGPGEGDKEDPRAHGRNLGR